MCHGNGPKVSGARLITKNENGREEEPLSIILETTYGRYSGPNIYRAMTIITNE